jgi:hypothetical protein
MTERLCGSTDTVDGHQCQNAAGLGTESDIGPCHIHDPSVPGPEGAGRPSKFDDERARQAVEAAREFKSLRGCARAAGVHHETIVNWAEKNPDFVDEDGETKEFFAALMRARSEAETYLTRGPITNPDDIDGQHARFLLANSYGYENSPRLTLKPTDDLEDDETDFEDLDEIFQ